jgi:hypothetical protein
VRSHRSGAFKAQLDRDDIVWFWIGTHAEYDQLLRSR